MAQNNQIYAMLNDVLRDMYGMEVSEGYVVDTASFTSLGHTLTSDDLTFSRFVEALHNRIGYTYFVAKMYESKFEHKFKNAMEWGAIYRKVRKNIDVAMQNQDFLKSAYPTERPMNITEYNPNGSFIATVFEGSAVWEYSDVIYGDQLRDALLSETEFGGYVNQIWTELDNSFNMSRDALYKLAHCTFMATTPHKINVAQEYRTETGLEVTINTWKRDTTFLKWLSEKIKNTISFMKERTVLFNDGSTPVDSDNLELQVITDLASAFAVNLEADVYHNELLALPYYEERPYWQFMASGSFDDRSCVDIEYNGEQHFANYVLATLCDADKVACYVDRPRRVSKYDELNDRTIISAKAKMSWLVDPVESGVIFYFD